jgi:hypothetical protein
MTGKRCRFLSWRMSLSANRIPLRRDMREILFRPQKRHAHRSFTIADYAAFQGCG